MFWKTVEVNYKERFGEVVLVQKHRLTGKFRVRKEEVENR